MLKRLGEVQPVWREPGRPKTKLFIDNRDGLERDKEGSQLVTETVGRAWEGSGQLRGPGLSRHLL